MKINVKMVMCLLCLSFVGACKGPPLSEKEVTQFDRYDRLHGDARYEYKNGQFGERETDLRARLRRRDR